MKLLPVKFNRNPLVFGKSMEQPTFNDIKSTFGLWNASMEDAIRYGGELTRAALQTMNIRNDRKNIIVDTKIHMLMPGMSPAIPGWHTDGAPRDKNKNPQGKDLPDTFAQENDERFNHYHILVTGTGCLTKFLAKPTYISIPDQPNESVYAVMSNETSSKVKEDPTLTINAPTCTSVEFDWWDIHTGVIAEKHEWRYLIRVCESDYYQPRKDLREVIRLQSQVYAPANFGW